MSYIKIPEDVERSEFLCPMSKLLFGRLAALSQKEGYCWATNQHLADWYKCSPSQVTRWISELSRAGFIEAEYNKTTNTRRIVLTYAKTPTPLSKNADTPQQKCGVPLSKNAETPQQKCVIKNSITKEEKRKEYIQPTPEQAQGLFIFLSLFEDAVAKYYTEGCATKPTKKSDKIEACFLELLNIALKRADLPFLDEKSAKQHNPTQDEKNAVTSEIEAFLAALPFYKKEKARFEGGKGGFYGAKLIKTIIAKQDYKKDSLNKVSGEADKVNQACADWKAPFLAKLRLQPRGAGLTEKQLGYLIAASRATLGLVIDGKNTRLTRVYIGEFWKSEHGLNAAELTQKQAKEAMFLWLKTPAGVAFRIYAEQEKPVFLREQAGQIEAAQN